MTYQRKVEWGLYVLLFCFILSAYSNSLFAPFTLDDTSSFVIRPEIHNFSFSLEGLRSLTKTSFGFSRFLPMLSFALDMCWGSGSLMAFHVTNIAIHILAAIALMFMTNGLFSLCFCAEKGCGVLRNLKTFPGIIAICIVGVWSLNPVQTNAVTYLVQRMTSMAALFFFLAVGCYLQGRRYQILWYSKVKSAFFYGGCAVFWGCAMMSKQNAATLPAILILIEWLIVDSSGLIEFLKKHKIVIGIFVVMSAGAVCCFVVATGMLSGYGHRHFTLLERLFTELRVVVDYIFLLLAPLPAFLNFEHDPVVSTSLFSPLTTMFSLILILAIIAGAWKLRKKQPLITFGIFWFFVNLLIESTIFPLELEFEHRMYLPSAGFFLALVVLVLVAYNKFFGEESAPHRFTIIISIVIILFSFLSLATYYRNATWQDSVTLYRDCVRKSPNKPRAHSNLAKALAEAGEYDEALAEGEKAIALGKKGYNVYWVSATNLILTLSSMGNNEEAISRAKLFVEQAPEWASSKVFAYFISSLGNIYLKEKKYELAITNYIKGLKFCLAYDIPFLPTFENGVIDAWNAGLEEGCDFSSLKEGSISSANEKLAEVYFSLNQNDKALLYCNRAVKENPLSPEARKIADKLEKIERADAIQQQKGSIKSKYANHPFISKYNLYMATAYYLMKIGLEGPFVQYIINKAETINSNNVDIYWLKSWLLFKENLFNDAIVENDKAIALDPTFARLWINRGLYSFTANRYEDTVTALSKAIELYPAYPHKKQVEDMLANAKEKSGVLNNPKSQN